MKPKGPKPVLVKKRIKLKSPAQFRKPTPSSPPVTILLKSREKMQARKRHLTLVSHMGLEEELGKLLAFKKTTQAEPPPYDGPTPPDDCA